MKMHKHFGLVLTACLVLSLLFTPAFLLPAQAANTVTVQGHVRHHRQPFAAGYPPGQNGD